MLSELPNDVLLVDDQPANLLAYEAILQGVGAKLVKAVSGLEALNYLLGHDVAVILLDVNMPGMDGFETAKLIRQRERTRNTPLIFVTATYKDDITRFAGYAVGAVDYLEEPVMPEILRAKVVVFVELFRQQDLLKRKEEQLRLANQELQRNSWELEQFCHVISHDLMVPLGEVMNILYLWTQRYQGRLDAETDQYMARAINVAEGMVSRIEDLLCYTRVGAEAKSPEPTDCGTVVDNAVAQLRLLIQEKDAVVTRDRLPVVPGEPTQLLQLFQNLIANALKSCQEKLLRIHIRADRRGGEWVFSVHDNGIGIDPQDQERIFHLFRRLHGQSEYPGTGICLAICKKVVEGHGGRIWVQSDPARGSTFLFTLPALGDSPSSLTLSPEGSGEGERPTQGPQTIL